MANEKYPPPENVNDDIPSQETVATAANHPVFKADGSSIPFRDVISGDGTAKRVLVIFVRHFFCGNCQEYVLRVSESVKPDDLASLPTSTSIAIMGCGGHELIKMYGEVTGCPYPIYSDPTGKLYDILQMTHNLALGPKKPDYIRKSLPLVVFQGIYQGLSKGWKATKAGDVKQIGGEFLFEGGNVTWCHRMKHTRDHSEIVDVKKVLGLDVEKKLVDPEKSAPAGAAQEQQSAAVTA